MIVYTKDVEAISEDSLEGFFVDWPNPPSKAVHMRILKGSYLAWLAIEQETRQVVGFITALSDGVLSAYIPLLEVLPSHQRAGIGKELVRLMLASLADFYMIDLLCDEALQGYYAKLGMAKATGALMRNYSRQNGS